MSKMTKEELKVAERLVAELTRQEGWPYLKSMVDNFVMITQTEIMSGDATNRDKMAAMADKLKFGTGAILWLFSEAEKIRERLDNND